MERRDFLKNALLSTAAISLGTFLAMNQKAKAVEVKGKKQIKYLVTESMINDPDYRKIINHEAHKAGLKGKVNIEMGIENDDFAKNVITVYLTEV